MQRIRPNAPFASVGPGTLVIAHRGGSLEAPENTLASIRHGVSVGSDWQEVDVTLSQDETPVVIHDDRLDRTTDGHGLVENTPLKDLLKLHTGRPSWSLESELCLKSFGLAAPDFGDTYASERVPTLEAILGVPGSRVMIEMKKSSHPARLASQIVRAVHKTRASDRVALGSFEFDLVDAVHQIDPSLPLIGIVETVADMDRMLDLPIAVLAVDKKLAAEALRAAPAGVAVWTWTVYTSKEAVELQDLGVNGVITDAPRALVEYLRPRESGDNAVR